MVIMNAVAEKNDLDLQRVAESLCRERQLMLVMFCRVAGLDPVHSSGLHTGLLGDFCQILIDYTALSHFEFFDHIARQPDLDPEIRAELGRVFSAVSRTTEVALAFNDDYAMAETDARLDAALLEERLSTLGQVLAERTDLEDRIISKIQSDSV